MREQDRTFFPWASVIRFGLSRLRLTPEAFWRLSLPELNALIGADDAPAMATRQGLEALMQRFPDMITPEKTTPIKTANKEPADDR
ncbi:MAG: rcc01693 family protein [Hoeflea sp.]|uniref:rcc01693 family protein n=1 Tax=Hoeflea sp. TaxID=1940281 RepID=UPI003296F974